MYWLESAKPTDLPPIFGHYVGTTAVIAAMAAVGPLSLAQMSHLASDQLALKEDLRRLRGLGVLSSYTVPMMRGNPVVYYLNQKHAGFKYILGLGKEVWQICVKPKLVRAVTTEFVRSPSGFYEADGAAHLWRSNYAGRVVHLLAQSEGEIRVTAIREFFKEEDYKAMGQKVLDRLMAFGIIKSRMVGTERWVQYNDAHPYGRALRRYVRWLNHTHFPQYMKLNDLYSRRLRNGYYESAVRHRNLRVVKELISAAQPSNLKTHGKKIKKNGTKPSRDDADLY